MSDLKMRYGFVCVLDILGTKEIWKKENTKSLVVIRDKLIKDHEQLLNKVNKDGHIDLKMQTISDTIIISTHLNNDKKFMDHYLKYIDGRYKPNSVVKKVVFEIIKGDITSKKLDIRRTQKLISLIMFETTVKKIFNDYFENQLFMRGAISYDKFYTYGKTIIIGPAINRATQDYDKSNWIGIHYDQYSTSMLDKEKLFINKYTIPFKGYSLKLGYVSWSNNQKTKEYYLTKLVETKQKITEKSNNKHNDVEIARYAQKYDNTIQFIKDTCKTTQTK